jgi:hypothetical protein
MRKTILADSSAIAECCFLRVVGKPAIASTALYLLVDGPLFLDFFLAQHCDNSMLCVEELSLRLRLGSNMSPKIDWLLNCYFSRWLTAYKDGKAAYKLLSTSTKP